MNKRFHEILNNMSEAAQKTYDGKKRNDLKDSDFLFPATRSFPIVSPADVKDAISNFGRMKSSMNYETFLRKLYNFCKRKGPEFVAALPENSKEKLGIDKSKSDYNEDLLNVLVTPNVDENIPMSLDDETNDTDSTNEEQDQTDESDYRQEFLEMSISSLKNILYNVSKILENINTDLVKENLTEPWLQGMIAITEDNMTTIHDFVMLNEELDDNTSEGGSKPGLWDNIRKKKERMGKNYKPAKPGDKDRPDSETWKKLTKDSKKSK